MITRSSTKSITLGSIVVLSGLLFLTGCSPTAEPKGFWGKLWKIEVGPDYKRPDAAPVDEFRSQIGPAENVSLADLPWWSVFKDQNLQQLIAVALAHNYDLQLAVARVDQARSLVWVAASPFYPQAGYQAFAGRERIFLPNEEAGGNLTFNAFGALLNATWEIDVWGRIRRSTEAARANLFAQEDVRRGVMLTLVSDVATGYFRLIELDREMAIAQESSRTYKQTLDLFSQRFEFGKDSKLPVERAQAAYDFSIASIASLQRARVQQENALSVLLGAYPREIERGMDLTEQSMPIAPVGLTTDLLQRRPDIMQAEQTMIGANAEIGVAVANFFPRIGITALYGGQSPNIGDVFESSFSIWNIAGGFAGPLFQGGRLIESYYAQQAFWDQTIAQYKQTVLVAFQEVSDSLIAEQTLIDQRAALVHQVGSLRESVDLSLLRYNAGRASYFEVLEAEQLLFPAEDAVAQTQRDQLLAIVNLYKALGGGWNLSDTQWSHRG
ncbi:MAG: efflux transporter outer membrane subunit [Candidatus Binatus sp.]